MQRCVEPTLSQIVHRARELPIERRFAYLREACQGDQALLQVAIASFELEITHAEWWEDPASLERVNNDPTVGMIIGRYIVARKIGSGGMSDVLLAAPRDGGPDVAIKLIRRANASPQLHSRLKVERQILGALDHPNIARLLDGGSTSDGMPYLVMEYLSGEPIDQYCNRRLLTISQRLRLFQSVCRAVHAAHQLSIVHRDLKPSNILVTSEGVPKLMDFGIAKILDDKQAQQTQVVTHADVRLLTPEYASPEQIRGDAITPASDVYSLGVLLYELLSGCNPRVVSEHIHAATGMRSDSPPPLHHLVAIAMNDASRTNWLAAVCSQRSTSPALLHHELHGDLNAIVTMALTRDPAYRHASAEALASRIDQHVTSGSMKSAQGPKETYRDRHRSVATVVAIALILLVIGIVVAVIRLN